MSPAVQFPAARIVVEFHLGQWSAWWDGTPEWAFGGDSPGTAVDRLYGNVLEQQDRQPERKTPPGPS